MVSSLHMEKTLVYNSIYGGTNVIGNSIYNQLQGSIDVITIDLRRAP